MAKTLRNLTFLVALSSGAGCDALWSAFLEKRPCDVINSACPTGQTCKAQDQLCDEYHPVQPVTSQTLYGIWGSSADNIWAVGGGGTILAYQDQVWSGQSANTASQLNGVWGTGNTNIWAVGAGGTIVHFNAGWTPQTSGTVDTLNAVWGVRNASTVWAVGGSNTSGTILYTTTMGAAWMKQSAPATSALHAIWGVDSQNIWAVGDGGKILFYDGSWTAQASGTTGSLYAVWGTSASDVWAVGYKDTILHFDGAVWSQAPQSATPGATLYGVWGSGQTVWALGQGLAVLKRSSGGWGAESSNFHDGSDLYGIWGSSPSSLWAVGTNGTILPLP